MEIWELTTEDPRMLKYVGQRTAYEVFAELEHRLDSMGFLPDEYFLLNSHWENGREIPKDAELFSTTDYGGSEGIYIDIYLKWHDEQLATSVTMNFITGKTLGETEVDLDRMNLIASEITKCFRTGGVHARYVRLGEAEQPEGCVMHLNGTERRILIDSLVSKYNRLTEETHAVEQLLRRVTGNITEYINEMGKRPIVMSDFDTAVLAIHDGCLAVFRNTFQKTPDKIGDLLVHAAGRPGNIGKFMVGMILSAAKGIPNEIYLNACKRAIETGDADRTVILVKKAGESRAENDLTIYGKLISHAMYTNKRNIAREILNFCTAEMIAAADPLILPQAIQCQDYNIAFKLIENGIDSNRVASEIIHALTYKGNDRYYFKLFLERGMVINNYNYSAMQACIRTESPEQGKMLIDRGLDFGLYVKWVKEQRHTDNTGATFDEIMAYWESRKE